MVKTKKYSKSMLILVTLGVFILTGTALAQEKAKPVVNLGNERIVQFGMVVKDAQKTAKRLSGIFGMSWKFYDLRPKDMVIHNKAIGEVDSYLKVAVGEMGGRSFKLIQPVSGPSSYKDFLDKQGEGFYYISLGVMQGQNYNKVIDALKQAGVGIEMQGSLGGNAAFTILDTLEDVGCYIEMVKPLYQGVESNMKLTGTYTPKGASAVKMDQPLFAGGKRIKQVGIVLKDEKKASQRYWELFGIGPWRVGPIPPKTEAFLNEKPVPPEGIAGLANDAAFANWGDMEFELLKPAGGPSCHRGFLDKYGDGIQHVSFGRQADYDAVIAAMKKKGINSEYSATLGGTSMVNYLAMQGKMGGFQLEITKFK